MNMHHRGRRGARVRCGDRLELTGIRSLKTPGPGAVAHMSLHQKPTMSKSRPTKVADSGCSPIMAGGQTVRTMLATVAIGASRNRQRRVGEGPYMEASDSGQPPFCNFISQTAGGIEPPRKSGPAARKFKALAA